MSETRVTPYPLPHTEQFWGQPIVTIERDTEWPAEPAALIRTFDPAPLRMDPVAAARMSATILAASDPTGRYVVVDTQAEPEGIDEPLAQWELDLLAKSEKDDPLANIKVGNPDPTGHTRMAHPICAQEMNTRADSPWCTRDPGHLGQHVAGNGRTVVATLPAGVTP